MEGAGGKERVGERFGSALRRGRGPLYIKIEQDLSCFTLVYQKASDPASGGEIVLARYDLAKNCIRSLRSVPLAVDIRNVQPVS